MSPFLCLNGRIVKAKDAVLSVEDRAVLWGDGLFETLRAYGGKPFLLVQHLRRMARSARFFKIGFRLNAAHAERVIVALLQRNRMPNAAVRLTLTRGKEGGGTNWFILTRPLPAFPRGAYEKGVSVALAPWRRLPTAPLYGHKTLNYLENIWAREWAKRQGAFEALFLDPQGRLLEGTASNLFVVKKGVVLTPPLSEHILPGVTRRLIFELCQKNRIPLREKPLALDRLYHADEVFITNSLIEVVPVTRCGAKKVGRGRVGEVTAEFMKLYRQYASGTNQHP